MISWSHEESFLKKRFFSRCHRPKWLLYLEKDRSMPSFFFWWRAFGAMVPSVFFHPGWIFFCQSQELLFRRCSNLQPIRQAVASPALCALNWEFGKRLMLPKTYTQLMRVTFQDSYRVMLKFILSCHTFIWSFAAICHVFYYGSVCILQPSSFAGFCLIPPVALKHCPMTSLLFVTWAQQWHPFLWKVQLELCHLTINQKMGWNLLKFDRPDRSYASKKSERIAGKGEGK